MRRGFSLHIGVNNLDSGHYGGSGFETLNSCIKDSNDMASIAKFHHFEDRTVLPDANSHQVIKNIQKYTKNGSNPLQANDILLITFSGHGDQVPDNIGNEFDSKDERWCLYDRELLDDELLNFWSDFNEGVRVLVISDSCNSGTVTDFFKLGVTNNLKFDLKKRGFDFKNFAQKIYFEKGYKFGKYDERIWTKNTQILEEDGIKENLNFDITKLDQLELVKPKVKTIPQEMSEELRERNKEQYDEIKYRTRGELLNKLQNTNERDVRDLVKASILLLSACQDWDITFDGQDENDNSIFTKSLKYVWSNGKFSGNYPQFRNEIWQEIKKIRPTQKPNYYLIGNPNSSFELQTPFTI